MNYFAVRGFTLTFLQASVFENYHSYIYNAKKTLSFKEHSRIIGKLEELSYFFIKEGCHTKFLEGHNISCPVAVKVRGHQRKIAGNILLSFLKVVLVF